MDFGREHGSSSTTISLMSVFLAIIISLTSLHTCPSKQWFSSVDTFYTEHRCFGQALEKAKFPENWSLQVCVEFNTHSGTFIIPLEVSLAVEKAYGNGSVKL